MPDRHVDHLLIGGGTASANCARWLREEGAEGTILIVGREPDAPYERPDCSKGYLRGEKTRQDALFRPAAFWDEHRIELSTRTSVTAIDLEARTATLSSKQQVSFGHALLATGANVRRLNVTGCDLEQIHYLRTLGNSDAIREGTRDVERVVLIGGSYIGCEVAASLAMLGKRCTIVMQEDVVLERSFGPAAGSYFQGLLEEHGVEIYGGDELERFDGEGTVARVVTRAGLELDAEAVVVGAGVAPDVSLARRAGLELGARGGVLCNSRLRTPVEGVYAAGDICEYASVVHGGRHVRIEHWDVAFNHGKTVALNMLGRDVPHDTVPYFFSDLGDWGGLEYVGPASGWEEEVVRGAYAEGSFTTFYLDGGSVRGALTVGRSDDLDHARRLISSSIELGEADRRALGDGDADLGAVGT